MDQGSVGCSGQEDLTVSAATCPKVRQTGLSEREAPVEGAGSERKKLETVDLRNVALGN